MIKFGYSKDKRPDLRQYRQMLATLDPKRDAFTRSDFSRKWRR